jgi:hypothetical protein
MAESNFQVNVPSGVSSPDIRNLTDAEKNMARKLGLAEEQYRQSKADLLAGEERRRERGQDLGEIVQQFLTELGPDYRILSITWNVDTLTWRLEIGIPGGAKKNVALSWELVDDALDAQTKTELRRLRNMVFFGLGRRDMIFGNRK